jgi:hypothetical protein
MRRSECFFACSRSVAAQKPVETTGGHRKPVPPRTRNSLGLVEASSDKLLGDANSPMEMSSTPAQDVYEIRPRKERDGFDLISDRLRRGPIWYAGPDAVRNAVAFAKYCSRSRWAIIRVFNESGNVTETHEQ